MVKPTEPDQPDRDDEAPRPPEESNEARAEEGSWIDETYPLVDSDFVGSTLDRVLHDRSEIESEAACVEQIRFGAGFLAQYAGPVPSAGFVEDTLARVLAERAAGRCCRTEEEYEFQTLIEQAQVPEPGAGFVERTLRMVLEDRRNRIPAPSPSLVRRRFSFAASMAAIVICAFVLFWDRDPVPEPRPIAAPLAWASLLTVPDDPDGQFVVPIRSANRIAAFAADIREGK